MTRKDAIKQAIAILSKEKGTKKIVKKLEEIGEDLPIAHWSDSMVRDVCDQFVKDKKRNPQTREFVYPLPTASVIHRIYHISVGEWLQENYPQEVLSREDRKKKYTEDFIREYNRVKPLTGKQFDREKTDSVQWQTVAKYHGIKGWEKLLETLGLEKYEGRRRVAPVITEFDVQVSSNRPELDKILFG